MQQIEPEDAPQQVRLSGRLFDSHTSKSHSAILIVCEQGTVKVESTELGTRGCHWSELIISPHIGSSARYLDLPNGFRFESNTNDQIDQLTRQFGGDNPQGWIHFLESKLRFVLISVCAVMVFVWWGVQYGLPGLAKQVAFQLPVSTNQQIARHTLETLDQYVFDESSLDSKQSNHITLQFEHLVSLRDDEFEYRLHLRDGGKVGANAFALPSGDIIITDQLIALAGNDAELEAVMAHELGHVNQRHGLRTVLQSSALPLLLISISGDMATASTLLAALPTILIESHYSRGFELEADLFAKTLLIEQKKDPQHLVTMLKRLTGESNDQPPAWLSSHPATSERIKQLNDD